MGRKNVLIPSTADLRVAFPETQSWDDSRLDALRLVFQRADESAFARGVMHERATWERFAIDLVEETRKP